jgi:formate-dependent nitrite reductase cytochrome c552 subunit
MSDMRTEQRGPAPLRPVDIYTPHKAVHDIKHLEKVTRDVLNRLGCANCHSGYDLRFREFDPAVKQIQAFQVSQQLEVKELLDSSQLG